MALTLTVCRSSDVFQCSSDAGCGDGVCTSEGYCAFPDTDCPSGLRYGEFAPSALAGECVDESSSATDLSTSTGTPSTSSTSSPPVTSTSTTDASTTTTEGSDDPSASGTVCPADWWDCAWSHRRQIDIVYDAPDPLDGFPVHVLLTPDRFDFEVAATDGSDLRFVAEGEILPHELVAWQPNSAELWVRVRELPAVGPIHVYYGNAEATDLSSPSDVWANDYRAVLHLLDERDSLGGLVLDPVNVEPAPGLLGAGLQFDGATSYLQDQGPPIDVFANGGTLSVLFNAAGWGEGSFGRLLDASDINTTANGWSLALANVSEGGSASIRFGRGHVTNRGEWYTPNNTIALEEWTVVAASYHDGVTNAPSMWIGGQPNMILVETAPSGMPSPAPLPLTVGALATTDLRFFNGIIDEIHIAGLRSDAWIAAEHLSFTDQLLAYGPAESH